MHPRSTEIRSQNTLLRLMNVVFGYCLIDRLLRLNDLKSRLDHETGQMIKKFWEDAANIHNDFTDNDEARSYRAQ
jgi:hypothetical protein